MRDSEKMRLAAQLLAHPRTVWTDTIESALRSLSATLDALTHAARGSTTPSNAHLEVLVDDARRSGDRVRAAIEDLLSRAPGALAKEPQQRPSRAPAPLRLLVVDEEVLVGKALTRLFYDCEVVTRHRAGAALAEIVAGGRFDVIICDLVMPTMSGVDFRKALLRAAPEQAGRVVFLTASGFTEAAHELVASGAGPVMEKPFENAALRELVMACARRVGPR